MSPPDETTALDAVKAVQSLTGPELRERVRKEVGDPMLGMLALLARNLSPDDSEAETGRKVHLMVLAYLIRAEVADPSSLRRPGSPDT